MYLFIVLSLALGLTTPETGYVSGYAEGVFESVYQLRTEKDWWRNQPPRNWQYETSVLWADRDCDTVGTMVDLTMPDGMVVPALVADCMGDGETADWMLRNNIIGEVDYRTWKRMVERYGTPLLVELGRRNDEEQGILPHGKQ